MKSISILKNYSTGVLAFCLLALPTWAQNDFLIQDQAASAPTLYEAVKGIQLKPGFTATASGTDQVIARITPNAPINPHYTSSTQPDWSAVTLDQNLSPGAIAGTAGGDGTGGATYAVGFDLPKGVGTVPQLGIAYNSQGGEGVCGYGFSLTGIGAVTRGGQNPFYDGQFHGVHFDNQDRFYLNGQRLVLTGGDYIGTLTEFIPSNQPGAVVIPQYDNQELIGFTVIDAEGGQTEYGGTESSILRTPQGIYSWYLRKSTDRFGNYALYEYAAGEQFGGYGIRLTRVRYSGNESLGKAPLNEVRLYYQDKEAAYVRNQYVGGVAFNQSKLLNEVTITTAGVLQSTYAMVYRRDYNSSTVYRLSELHRYNKESEELNPTRFLWNEAPTSFISYRNGKTAIGLQSSFFQKFASGEFQQAVENEIIDEEDYKKHSARAGVEWYRVVDKSIESLSLVWNDLGEDLIDRDNGFDVDGLLPSDLDEIKNISAPMDLNRDGSPEMWLDYEAGGNIYSGRVVRSDNGDRWYWSVTTGKVNLGSASGYGLQHLDHIRQFGDDFNGDGKHELLVLVPQNADGSGTRQVYFRDALANGYSLLPHLFPASIADEDKTGTADFTGDGIPEVYLVDQTGLLRVYTYNWDQQKFELWAQRSLATTAIDKRNIRVADFNADGYGDVLVNLPGSNDVKIFFSDGLSVQSGSSLGDLGIPDQSLLEAGYNHLSLKDVNYDGYVDLIALEIGGGVTPKIHLWMNHPAAGAATLSFEHQSYTIPNSLLDSRNTKMIVRDWADDGGYGVLLWQYDEPYDAHLYNFAPSWDEAKLHAVVDGKGSVAKYEYAYFESSFEVYNTNTLIPNWQSAFSGGFSILPSDAVILRRVHFPKGTADGTFDKLSYSYGPQLINHKMGSVTAPIFFSLSRSLGTGAFVTTRTERTLKGNTGTVLDEYPMLVDNLVRRFVGTRDYQKTRYVRYAVKRLSETGSGQKVFTHYPDWIINCDYTNGRVIQNRYQELSINGLPLEESVYVLHKDEMDTLGTTDFVASETTAYSRFTEGVTGVAYLPQTVEKTVSRPGETSFTTKTDYTYNQGNLVKSVTDEGLENEVTQDFQYDSYGNLTAVTTTPKDEPGTTVQYTFDRSGRFSVSTTDAMGRTSTRKVDAVTGLMLEATDGLGLTTSWNYNTWDRVTATKLPDGRVLTSDFGWNPGLIHGTLYRKIDQLGDLPQTTTYIDAFGNRLLSESETALGETWVLGSQSTRGFLHHFQPPKVEQPGGGLASEETTSIVEVNYDITGREIERKWTDHRVEVHTDYDRDLGISKILYDQYYARNVRRKYFKYNELGELIRMRENILFSTENQVDYHYNARGLTREISLENTWVRYQYNRQGLITLESSPDFGEKHFEYDSRGLLTHYFDDVGNDVQTDYDAFGRPVTVTTPSLEVNYSYDGQYTGLMDKVSSDGHTLESQYDELRRIDAYKETYQGQTRTYDLDYDQHSRVKKQTLPGGESLQYGYYPNGQLKTVSFDGQQVLELVGFNKSGGVSKARYGNGREYTHDGYFEDSYLESNLHPIPQHDWVSVHSYHVSGDLWGEEVAVDNKTGNVLQRATPGYYWHQPPNPDNVAFDLYTYDDNDRLTGVYAGPLTDPALKSEYVYDNYGNMLYHSDRGWFEHPESPRLGDEGATTTASTPAKLRPNTGAQNYQYAIQNIEYDERRQPVRIVTQDALGSVYEVNFTYDFTGSRRKMVVYQTPAGGSPERVFTKEYHDGYVVYDYPDKADVSYFYVRAAGKLWAIVEKQGNQVKTHYVISDYLGSIRMLLDENGNVEQEFQYGPWGMPVDPQTREPLGFSDVSYLCGLGYTGQEYIPFTDLYHYGGRLYDPVTCRMLQPDVVIADPSKTQSYHRFAYVMNNPLKYTDPTGYIPSGVRWDVTPQATQAAMDPFRTMTVYEDGARVSSQYNHQFFDAAGGPRGFVAHLSDGRTLAHAAFNKEGFIGYLSSDPSIAARQANSINNVAYRVRMANVTEYRVRTMRGIKIDGGEFQYLGNHFSDIGPNPFFDVGGYESFSSDQFHNADGTLHTVDFNLPTYTGSSSGGLNSSGRANNGTIETVAAGIGAFEFGAAAKNELIDFAGRKGGELSKGTASYLKLSKGLARGAGYLALGTTIYDGVTSEKGWQNHHTADLVIGVATVFVVSGPWGWAAAGVYFVADLTVQYYTGKSITENLFD